MVLKQSGLRVGELTTFGVLLIYMVLKLNAIGSAIEGAFGVLLIYMVLKQRGQAILL